MDVTHFFKLVAPKIIEIGRHVTIGVEVTSDYYFRAVLTIERAAGTRRLSPFAYSPLADTTFMTAHAAAVVWVEERFTGLLCPLDISFQSLDAIENDALYDDCTWAAILEEMRNVTLAVGAIAHYFRTVGGSR